MNFALFLFVALVITGSIWLFDILRKMRLRKQTGHIGIETEYKESLLVEYAKSFFPVILIVFVIRSFLVEPFKIPSGSMIPTLQIGDYILVNKFTYGIRLPVLNKKIIEINPPKNGDVMVFRYPENPTLDYIKRVVGVPGDKIEYRNKQLKVNGQIAVQHFISNFDYEKGGFNHTIAKKYKENLNGVAHEILVQTDSPTVRVEEVKLFSGRENCQYQDDGFSCVVPQGQYFLMGDNRDDSNDSRYWGFVPDENIVGKAFLIWFHWEQFDRIGISIR